MPFILRPVKDGDGDGGETYNLIGDCYLQGAMDGEFARRKVRGWL